MSRFLGAAAGGTLGFIAGNVPGAVAGAKLGYKLGDKRKESSDRSLSNSRRMHPTPRSRSRSRGRAPTRASRSPATPTPVRSASRHSVTMRSRSRSAVPVSRRTTFDSKTDSTNVTQVAQFKKGSKVAKEGRTAKKVHVSKSLRAKVKKVLEGPAGYGWYKEIQTAPLLIPIDNDLTWRHLSPATHNNIASSFDPGFVLGAASILFNTRIPTTPNTILASGVTGDVDNFRYEQLKVHVLESNMVARMFNNTSRVLTLKFYDLSPKQVSAGTTGTGDGWDPISFMSNALSDMAPQAPLGSADGVSNSNPLNVLISTQGFTPGMIPSFKKFYTVDETIVELEPGKHYNHKVSGPRDKMYDYQKFIQNGIFCNQQKFVKHTIFSCSMSLTGTTTGGVGRFTEMQQLGQLGFGLIWETTQFVKIKMPEQAGYVVPSVVTAPVPGKSQSLTQRKDAFAIKHYTVSQTGLVTIVGDESEVGLTGAGV